jgi:hypothetical protein
LIAAEGVLDDSIGGGGVEAQRKTGRVLIRLRCSRQFLIRLRCSRQFLIRLRCRVHRAA